MVANIVLVLSLGGNIPLNPINATIRSHKTLLYTSHYYFLLPCRGWRTCKQLCLAPPLICLEIFSTWCIVVILLLILKQMDVNQNLPNRERKMQSACLFLPWGGMNNYWLVQGRIKNYSISHKVLVYTVCNLLCRNLSNRKPQYPPPIVVSTGERVLRPLLTCGWTWYSLINL